MVKFQVVWGRHRAIYLRRSRYLFGCALIGVMFNAQQLTCGSLEVLKTRDPLLTHVLIILGQKVLSVDPTGQQPLPDPPPKPQNPPPQPHPDPPPGPPPP